MPVKLVYFAWIRETIGKPEDLLELPVEITDVTGLLAYLPSLGDNYAQALLYPEQVRVAINHEHAEHQTSLHGAQEIALFPPMTGG